MARYYSKVEVFEAFATKNVELMRSLITNETVKRLGFTEPEKAEITRNLTVLLIEIINEPDNFHGYNFKPLYYDLFRDEYVKALLELVGEDFEGFEYHYMWIWNLNKYSMPILKAKIKGTLFDLKFADNTEFCLIVSTIGAYFGSKELLHFLNATDHFDVFYDMIPAENEAIAYLLEVTLIQVALAIIDNIKSTKAEDQNAAISLQQKFMELIRYFFMNKERIINAEIAYHIFRFLDKREQLSLISSTIKSIPQEILDVFLNNPRMRNLNELLVKALE